MLFVIMIASMGCVECYLASALSVQCANDPVEN